MVELKMLGGYGKLQAKHPGVKVIKFENSLKIELLWYHILLCFDVES